MGLGEVPSGQEPVQLGSRAKTDPILSTASVIASDVMLRMASLPKSKRAAEMVAILNAGQAGSGDAAYAEYMRRAASEPSDKKDQAMFDAIRATIANTLVEKVLASRPGMSGLGQTLAEARGQTSRGVNDANAIFCSYVAGTSAIVGGYVDRLASGGTTENQGAIGRGAVTGGSIAGCNAGQLLVQGQIATDQARLAQQGTILGMQQQQAASERTFKLMLGGAAVLGVLGIGVIVAKKVL
jgi:hypothetical protein